jgi:hypothetical protein
MSNVDSNEYTGTSGIYVAAIPTKSDVEHISSLVKSLDAPFSLDKFNKEAHMTINYSRKKSVDVESIKFPDNGLVGLGFKLDYWLGHDEAGYVVLRVISKGASDLHEHVLSLGAEHSFSTYDSHMTICDSAATKDPDVITNWINKANDYLKTNSFIIHFDSFTISDCKQ